MKALPKDTLELLPAADEQIQKTAIVQEYTDRTGIRVRSMGNSVSMPTLLSKVDPQFSEEARQQKQLDVVVRIALMVDPEGNPQNVRVIGSAGMGLDEQAVLALRQYKFKPATENGKPVPFLLNVEVRFLKS